MNSFVKKIDVSKIELIGWESKKVPSDEELRRIIPEMFSRFYTEFNSLLAKSSLICCTINSSDGVSYFLGMNRAELNNEDIDGIFKSGGTSHQILNINNRDSFSEVVECSDEPDDIHQKIDEKRNKLKEAGRGITGDIIESYFSDGKCRIYFSKEIGPVTKETQELEQ